MNKNRPFKNTALIALLTLLILVVIILADSLGYISKLESLFAKEQYNSVRFLDVGQGDCTLIKNEGKYFLIDAGNNVDDGFRVEQKLRQYNVKTIEGIVLSHLHSDHTGALAAVFENFTVKNIYVSDTYKDDENFSSVIAVPNFDNTNVLYLKNDDKIIVGNAVLEVLWNPNTAGGDNASLVLKANCDGLTFFFGGDISNTVERKMLDNNRLSRFNILKASHHGSKNSGCDEFLDFISPQYCVCFCGKDNGYGFPSEEFEERLNSRGITLFTTAENGDITFNTETKTFVLEKTKAAH